MIAVLPGWLETLAQDVAALWPLYLLVGAVLAAARTTTRVFKSTVREVADPLTEQMGILQAEFRPNGGQSMRDRQEIILEKLDEITRMVHMHETTLDVQWESAPEAFYIANTDGTPVKVNQSYLDLWGFQSAAEARTTEWLEKLTPDGRRLAEQRVAAMFYGDEHPPFSFDLQLADGRVLRVLGKPIYTAGMWEGYAGIVLDLSHTTVEDVDRHVASVEDQLHDHVEWEEAQYEQGHRKGRPEE